MAMNLQQLEIVANSIKAKGKLVTPENLMIESLFYSFGTLNEEQAQQLLWDKREQIHAEMEREGYVSGGVVCPIALEFLKWEGNKMSWD